MTSLGADLEVSEARKVRSGGLLGFFSKERYEVLAAPKVQGVPDAVCAEAAVQIDQTLHSLMARIEAEESAPASFAASLAEVEPDWHAELAEFIAVEAPVPVPVPVPVPAKELRGPFLPSRRPGEPAWSRAALRHLGLHDTIVDLLTVPDGADDQAWTMDLVAALCAALGQELAPLADTPVDGTITVSGHGPRAALGLIGAAVDGARPDLLHLGGGDVPATAMELALSVRSCLPR